MLEGDGEAELAGEVEEGGGEEGLGDGGENFPGGGEAEGKDDQGENSHPDVGEDEEFVAGAGGVFAALDVEACGEVAERLGEGGGEAGDDA